MTKLNYVIRDYNAKNHKINKNNYRNFDEFLDSIYIREKDLSDLLDPNASLQEDVDILVDDPFMTKDEIEKKLLEILKAADEYITKRYAETYYSDDVALDCEVSDAFAYEDTIDEFVLDDWGWEHAEEGDIKKFEIKRVCLELKIFKRLKRNLDTNELVDANEVTIDDEVVYEEKPMQYVTIYYYDNVEVVSKDDLEYYDYLKRLDESYDEKFLDEE